MLTYNLTGTQKGQCVLVSRPVADGDQHMSIVHRTRNMLEFASNGGDISFTQMLDIINEHDDGETACVLTDNTLWSPKGPLMRTQDARLRFLRFTQRESIVFTAVVSPTVRHLVEVQLAVNKFVYRTSVEMTECRPVSVDACGKYMWVVNMDNEIEVHNVVDKEKLVLSMPTEYTAKSVLCVASGSLLLLEHNTKHFAALTYLKIQDARLVMDDIKVLGKTSLKLQPGSLVQCKGAMLVTLTNAEQQQYLVTIGNNNNTPFQTILNTRSGFSVNGDPVQRILFTDVLVDANRLKIGVIVNRNYYSMWTVDMNNGEVAYAKLQRFPDALQDLILDRVVLMCKSQEWLEEQPSGTLLSSEITDGYLTRMRQQVEVTTSTARAMIDTSRTTQDTMHKTANVKDLLLLRDASETMRKHLMSEHEKELKEVTGRLNIKIMELEQRITDLIAARDARVPLKQHEQLKLQLERMKAELRTAGQTQTAQQLALTKKDAEMGALQQRVERLVTDRDTARALHETANDDLTAVKKLHAHEQRQLVLKHKQAMEKLQEDAQFDAGVMRDQLTAEAARWKLKFDTLLAEQLVLKAQLVEAQARISDQNLDEKVRQLTLQNEAAQNRSRIQFETLQREIDALRRANLTLSQSYQMLQSVTKFNFLPDGTSLETALQMMKHLTVFQQDLATARDENKALRKKVQELEAC